MPSLQKIAANSTIDPAKYGVKPDTNGDSIEGLQAIFDAMPAAANSKTWLAPGGYLIGRPLVIARSGVTIAGVGMRRTSIQSGFSGPMVYAGPLDDTSADGFTFSAGGRPDVFGLVDSTLASQPGVARGFATQGRTTLYLHGNAGNLGGFTGERWWDYWGGPGGCTIEFLVGGKFGSGAALMGMGDPNAEVLGIGCVLVSPDAPKTLKWMLGFEGEDRTIRHAVSFGGIDWSQPARIRLWYEPRSGEAGCWYAGPDGKGSDLTASWGDAGSRVGRTLRKNRKDYPFQVGSTGQVATIGPDPADMVFGGIRLSNAAIKSDPGTDRARYGTTGPSTVIRLATESLDPGRLVRWQEGPAATSRPAFSLALNARNPGVGIANFEMLDLALVRGGIMLAGTYDSSFSRVAASGNVGLADAKIGNNYTTRAQDCQWTGTDCGESRFKAIGISTGCDIGGDAGGCGITAIRETGCSIIRIGTLVKFTGPCPETAFDSWEGQYGGDCILTGFRFNNEASPLSVAVFRLELNGYERTSMTITGGSASWRNPGVPVYLLDSRPDPQYTPGRIDSRGFVMQGEPVGPVAVVNGAMGKWRGSIDVSVSAIQRPSMGTNGIEAPAPPAISGPGYDPAKLTMTGQ